jgi:hypothetical protein
MRNDLGTVGRLTLGSPQDAVRQLAVLRATLRVLEEISQPGTVVHLPFEWDCSEKLNVHPPELRRSQAFSDGTLGMFGSS